MIRFDDPLFLLLFIPLFLWVVWMQKTRKAPSILIGDSKIFDQLENKTLKRVTWLKKVLRVAILGLIMLTLARPQQVNINKQVISQGIDIMLALDVSGSMRTEDFKPHHRLAVAKQTMQDFIGKRAHDRIGLVVFSQKAFTQCPLTLDYHILTSFLKQADFDMVGSGTAIGLAIASSVNRLKNSPSTTKIVVLLTDGVNNSGGLDPLTAANLAKDLNIKIYTIGVGTLSNQPLPFTDPATGRIFYQRPELDENTLKEIASLTGGRYFRAKDSLTLKSIYDTIDSLEKTEIKTKSYEAHYDYFIKFLWMILGLFLFEHLLTYVFFRVVP